MTFDIFCWFLTHFAVAILAYFVGRDLAQDAVCEKQVAINDLCRDLDHAKWRIAHLEEQLLEKPVIVRVPKDSKRIIFDAEGKFRIVDGEES